MLLWTPLSIMRSHSAPGSFVSTVPSKVAGLPNNLKRIAELMSELANLYSQIGRIISAGPELVGDVDFISGCSMEKC